MIPTHHKFLYEGLAKTAMAKSWKCEAFLRTFFNRSVYYQGTKMIRLPNVVPLT